MGRKGVGIIIPLGTTVGLVGLWEVLARVGALPAALPPLDVIVSWLWGQLGQAAFWSSVEQTVWQWLGGLLVGGFAGIVLGAAIGFVPIVERLLSFTLEFLRPIPSIVYLPLVILVIGDQPRTAILLTSVGAFWPIFYQTLYGMHDIDPQAIETGKVFGLTSRQRLWHIMVPSVLPYVATGIRIASSLALVVAIGIELIGGIVGLGADLSIYAQNAFYPGMYAVLLVSGVLGFLANALLARAERRVLHWHVSQRTVSA